MRMIEERAMLVVCDDCGARAPCDRVHVTFARMDPSTREPGLANTNALDLPDGWTEGRVTPEGKPILVAGGIVRMDPYKDSAADIATKTGLAQPVARCPVCSPKARARQIVESAGAVVVGLDGRPVQ